MKKLTSIMLSIVMLFLVTICYAAPVDESPREVTQADGTVITIRSFGDEYFSWTETMDGYVIEYDYEGRNWCYAEIVDNTLVPSQNIVGDNDIEQSWMLKHDDALELNTIVYGCVIISPKSTTLAVGNKKELTTYVNGPADRFHDYNITFSTSDEKIASVDDKGVVTAVLPGEVTITATSDHREYYNTATSKITVTADVVLPTPYPTFMPEQACDLTIKCVDKSDESVIYSQVYKSMASGAQTIYAPSLDGYKLNESEQTKTVDIVTPNDECVTFMYEKDSEKSESLSIQEDVSISPVDVAIKVECIDKDTNEVLYRQVIKNCYYGISQEIIAPPISGYKLSDVAKKGLITEWGENKRVFKYTSKSSKIIASKSKNYHFGTDIVQVDCPYTVDVKYIEGDDKFVKKSWVYAKNLENTDDLSAEYDRLKNSETVLDNTTSEIKKNVTVNGMYLFCAWTSDENNAPDYISYIDITDIEYERPMADIEFTLLGDYSKDVIAKAKVKNIIFPSEKTISSMAFVKGGDIAPYAPSPTEQTNEWYNTYMNARLSSWKNDGLELVCDENGEYSISDDGSYYLFLLDSDGNYGVIAADLPKYSIENDASAENGNIIVTLLNKAAKSQTVTVVYAYYDKNGSCLDIESETMLLSPNVSENKEHKIPDSLKDEAGSIKVFVWDSIDTMTPLADAKSIDF